MHAAAPYREKALPGRMPRCGPMPPRDSTMALPLRSQNLRRLASAPFLLPYFITIPSPWKRSVPGHRGLDADGSISAQECDKRLGRPGTAGKRYDCMEKIYERASTRGPETFSVAEYDLPRNPKTLIDPPVFDGPCAGGAPPPPPGPSSPSV